MPGAKYYAAHRDEIRAKRNGARANEHRVYYEKNKERLAARYQENREKYLAIQKAYYAAHREERACRIAKRLLDRLTLTLLQCRYG
jgi:hypothetical protein